MAEVDPLRWRLLMLAVVAAWRWARNDQFPNGTQASRECQLATRSAIRRTRLGPRLVLKG
jgi:hypothetical protein